MREDSLHPDPLEGTPYRGLRRIGAGASGEIWEAMHGRLAKRVVVKLLKSEHGPSREQHGRLRLEAQSLARLTHENIVRVTDSGLTAQRRAYVVMEHLGGHTLRQEIDAKGALPARRAIDVVVQLLAGLSAAHEIGIVHRDVKPDNVLLCPDAEERMVVKVLDFGLAKAEQTPDGPAPLEDPTAEGVSVGTPRYFSPEQARALPVDARTDVYAVGLVLHTLLYGRGPFDDLHGVQELARAHAKTVPVLPRLHMAEPAATELRQIVRRALAKRPADRFQTAAAMARALRAVADHLDAPPWPAPRHGIASPPPSTVPSDSAAPPSRAFYAAVLVFTLVLTGALSSMLLWALR